MPAQIARGLVALIVARAAFAVLGAFDIHPDQWIAVEFARAVPALTSGATIWILSAFGAIAVFPLIGRPPRTHPLFLRMWHLHRNDAMPIAFVIPLGEGAAKVYEATRGTIAAKMAEAEHPDGERYSVHWYCTAMAHQGSLPIYGRRLGGKELELIPIEVLRRGYFSTVGSEFWEGGERQPSYTGLVMFRRNVKVQIQRIREVFH